MKIIRNIEEMKIISKEIKSKGMSLGMVPTMGFLHEGHKSLIKCAKENNDIVTVSIFVNPTQFGPDEDYESYPRDLEHDSKICQMEGVDYIFHPEPDEMYPDGYSTFVIPGEKMTNILCGITRPGHFRGVCTVLTKLFSIINPDNAYFGEKDIQQLAIVRRMVKDLNLGVNINGCPIIREEDGLAKSSRNTYLNEEERKAAIILRKSILKGKEFMDNGEKNVEKIRKVIVDSINSEPLAKIDYVEIIDFDTFDRIEKLSKNTLIAMAVYIGKTRLIDNLIY
ncbi:pantoate--beta-alanine ligase [Peptostreptococcus canis]|uniref:Pantothenate synthetase n=1 Tax=Peptostreptococcus canis TaxID=1159213 RepID=A0ABR6TMM5_9FIRM|nr:pantoate--beta-alanine ligase [Peptostreptococcus canis]MBC2576662.1 pantoate--beta-alanine ligase [Peptostreptococcus canis]MBP1998588.1 pantoate--beta-alanine ligase [Peptostreptococcus canis]